jgi:hypothetical protein
MNDNSTEMYNATFDAQLVIDFMRHTLYQGWNIPDLRFHSGAWREKFTMKFAVVLTRFGFCSTFNIAEPDEFLRLDRISSNFNFTGRNSTVYSTMQEDFRSHSVDLNESYPWRTRDKDFGFRARFFRKPLGTLNDFYRYGRTKIFNHPKYLMSGARLMIHDVNEIPFKSSQVHYVQYLNYSNFGVKPVITRIDDSLIEFSPEE